MQPTRTEPYRTVPSRAEPYRTMAVEKRHYWPQNVRILVPAQIYRLSLFFAGLCQSWESGYNTYTPVLYKHIK